MLTMTSKFLRKKKQKEKKNCKDNKGVTFQISKKKKKKKGGVTFHEIIIPS